jgi:hypothetical protein
VRLAYRQHENRGANVPITIQSAKAKIERAINMKNPPPLENGFISLGKLELAAGERCVVTMSSEGAGGFAHADAIQLLAEQHPTE